MRINVEEIGDEGLELQESLTRAWLDAVLAPPSSVEAPRFTAAGPAQLSAHLEKFEGGVLLRAQSSPRLTTACRRCLRPVELTVPVSFALSLVPQTSLSQRLAEDDRAPAPTEAKGRGSFDPDDVDQETFDGHAIELDPLVREQLLLALPMDALCREDCKGLCPSCGQDLNERSCDCRADTADPRWAKLRSLKLSN